MKLLPGTLILYHLHWVFFPSSNPGKLLHTDAERCTCWGWSISPWQESFRLWVCRIIYYWLVFCGYTHCNHMLHYLLWIYVWYLYFLSMCSVYFRKLSMLWVTIVSRPVPFWLCIILWRSPVFQPGLDQLFWGFVVWVRRKSLMDGIRVCYAWGRL